MPVGAGLIARDNIVSTVRGIADTFASRAAMERELEKLDRRGATARDRFEHQVRRRRSTIERDLTSARP